MTEEMYLHCLKHTPPAFQNELMKNKDVIKGIIVLSNWSNVEACFNTFKEMRGYIMKYDEQYKSNGHWSFAVSQINPKVGLDRPMLWENEEYI